ncbi:2-oxo-4-hydroxy-4-carboxy-5-ureidoimidazoline decarboxylase [Candidatus Thioglobus sp.]|nr:2-oxo-4-hydroxy-4-carboxy-5-ureidoimidazoline decarboxylase [Candidatus Thioglobus sp.]
MELPLNLAQQSSEAFLKTFENLYEHTPCFVEKSLLLVLADKKYNSLEKFHELLSNIMLNADSDLQDNLIAAHPTLAGKKAQNNELTDFSTTEQKSAGLSDCSDSEIELFKELNREYFAKFDFPFIMAVKEKNKSDIISKFKERKDNSRNQERSNALDEINKIAWLRIKEIYGI